MILPPLESSLSFHRQILPSKHVRTNGRIEDLSQRRSVYDNDRNAGVLGFGETASQPSSTTAAKHHINTCWMQRAWRIWFLLLLSIGEDQLTPNFLAVSLSEALWRTPVALGAQLR